MRDEKRPATAVAAEMGGQFTAHLKRVNRSD